MITITTAANGWVVKESDGDFERVYCFSYDSIAGGDVEAFSGLLWNVTELCGMSGSRYDEKRIHIRQSWGQTSQSSRQFR
jgi:hypothetical protein